MSYCSANTASTRSDQFKAVFLYNFTLFIQWPNEEQLANLNICVWGNPPLKHALAKLVPGKVVRNLPLEMHAVNNSEQATECQLVFFSDTEQANKAKRSQILEQLIANGVLTVSDMTGFAVNGGVIEFFVNKNKLRFIINQNNLRDAGLKASAKLLDMAVLTE